MKAFIVNEESLDGFREVEMATPTANEQDVLVEVHAVALNPVDTKVRRKRPGKILGWDACGVVREVGAQVAGFRPGDRVYYAGDIRRPGSNATHQLVDHRLVAHAPTTLDSVSCAALPLTGLTAWEGLYEQLRVEPGRSILVINGAGGVGSLVTQLARARSDMTVIATASREESAAWAREMGAHHVVDHREDLSQQLRALGRTHVDYIFCCHDTALHFETMVDAIAPQGHIVSIVETDAPLPLGKLFAKKASFSWELMFTKSLHDSPDMPSQGEILASIATMVDAGTLRTTLRERGPLNAESLAEAHRRLGSGRMIGKLGLEVAR